VTKAGLLIDDRIYLQMGIGYERMLTEYQSPKNLIRLSDILQHGELKV
jgi:hypothetical protein